MRDDDFVDMVRPGELFADFARDGRRSFQTRVGGVGPGEFSAQVSRPSRRVRRARLARERVVRDRTVSDSPVGQETVSSRAQNRGTRLLRALGEHDVRIRLDSSTRLAFHATDFPTLARDERASLWIPYRRLGFSFVHVEHAGAAWFAYTATRAFAAVASSTRNFAAHRAWTWRHLAAGLGIALQRVFIWVHHLCFDLARGSGYSRGVAELQKPIFGDSLVYGGAVAALYCEWCVSFLTPATKWKSS